MESKIELDARLLMLVQNHLSKDEIDSINTIIMSKLDQVKSEFPFYENFLKNTQAGEDIEVLLSEKIFSDLTRVTGENYDHIIDLIDKKVEVKSIRMMTNDDKDTKYPAQRAISFFDKKRNKFSNTSFQQIKPAEFDYMIGILLYKDAVTVYLVPNDAFHSRTLPKSVKRGLKGAKLQECKQLYAEYLRLKDEKIVLSAQHKDNNEEGQIGFAQLEKYKKFSLYPKDDSFFYIKNGVKTDEKFDLKIADLLIENCFSDF